MMGFNSVEASPEPGLPRHLLSAAPAVLVLGTLTVAVLRIVYFRFLCPRPIPGIPHYVASTRRISGDLPTVLKEFETNKEVSETRYAHCRKLGSPIIQLFLDPLAKPTVFLDDPRESEDILLRRNKEFDRSPISKNTIGILMPHCSIVKQSNEEWKMQRRLFMDIMTPDFLRRVMATKIYDAAQELVELWTVKTAAMDGLSIDVSHDFDVAALDAIWSAILGDELGGTQGNINHFKSMRNVSKADHKDVLPSTGKEEEARKDQRGIDMRNTLRFLDTALVEMNNTWFPAVSRWKLRRDSEFQRYLKIKNAEIDNLMLAASARFQRILDGSTDGAEHDTCAMDLVLRRELLASQKAGVPMPDPTKDLKIKDELMLLLWAGHDTTSNTLAWFVKYMTNVPEVQFRLRSALQAAFPSATSTAPPSAFDILDADIPYLNATAEETLRMAATTARVNRVTRSETVVLGHVLPAGTDVIMNGVISHRPPPVAEELRSASSRAAAAKKPRGGIDGPAGDELHVFRPERWLFEGENGEMEFDAYALPRMAFGDGPRGCFGRRLAMMELNIMIVAVIWNFEFKPVPPELNSMTGVELLFRKPEQCFVNLENLAKA